MQHPAEGNELKQFAKGGAELNKKLKIPHHIFFARQERKRPINNAKEKKIKILFTYIRKENRPESNYTYRHKQ